jgi:NDP-sugar pyrophosphorylase family protein
MLKPGDLLDLESFSHRAIFDGVDKVWEALPAIATYLHEQAEELSRFEEASISPLADVADHGVILGAGCRVEAGAVIKGPTIIGAGSQIRAGAYIRGNAIIGEDVVIGNSCEIKNAIIFDSAEIPHYNYVGDAILGHRAHLGAGVILSNVRLDRRNVVAADGNGKRHDSGLRKFSAIVGDHTEIGCNSVISPGSVIGARCILYPLTHWQGYLPSDTIVKTQQEQRLVPRVSSTARET